MRSTGFVDLFARPRESGRSAGTPRPLRAPARRALSGWILLAIGTMLPMHESHGATPAPAPAASAPSHSALEVRAIRGAQVEIDGRTHGDVPVSVDLATGPHHIKVTAPGHHPWQATIELRSGAEFMVVSELVALGTAQVPTIPPRLEPTPPPAARSATFLTTHRPSPEAGGVFLTAKPSSKGPRAFPGASEPSPEAGVFLTAKHDAEAAEVFLTTAHRPHDVFLPARGSGSGPVFMPIPGAPDDPRTP